MVTFRGGNLDGGTQGFLRVTNNILVLKLD